MKSAAVVLAFAALLAGCATPAPDPGREEYRLADDYDARRPADVAVPSIAGSIPLGPSRALRAALREELLKRRYAPVRNQEVDRRPEEYAPGSANSVLQVRVTLWDEGRVNADGSVRVTAEARLFVPGGLEVLYIARLSEVVVVGPATAAATGNRERTLARAAAHLATRLLERLPPKGDG